MQEENSAELLTFAVLVQQKVCLTNPDRELTNTLLFPSFFQSKAEKIHGGNFAIKDLLLKGQESKKNSERKRQKEPKRQENRSHFFPPCQIIQVVPLDSGIGTVSHFYIPIT